MSAAHVLTLTCPRCAKQSRVGVEHAGQQTRCPHPDCRHALTIPLTLDNDDEPEEAVLIAEGPPVLWPVAPHATESRREPRVALWLWVLTAVVMLTTIAMTAAWALLRARPAPAPQVTAPEPPAQLPREKAAGPPRKAPAVRPTLPVEQPPPPVRPDPEPPAKPPAPRKPIDRAAFVGVWEVTWPDLRKNAGWEGTLEFRADGTSRFRVDTEGPPLELSGRWQWDGRRLHANIDTGGSTPVEVEWNGPDQFTATADGRPVLFRRKPKR